MTPLTEDERKAKRKRVAEQNQEVNKRAMAIAAGKMEAIYQRLRKDGQVWHEAEIDGYYLYMADTSFGNGPIFRIIGLERAACWQNEQGWAPIFQGTTVEDAEIAVALGERAEWVSRLEKLDS